MKTMQKMNKVVIVNGKAIFDIETASSRSTTWRACDRYLPVGETGASCYNFHSKSIF